MDNEAVEKDIISVSPGIVVAKVGNLRRNSMGQSTSRSSPSILNGTEKILPRYLRASTNSCHDFCKYGRRHVFDEKEKHLNPHKKVTGDVEKPKIVNLGGRKKKTLIKLKGTPELKFYVAETPEIIRQRALPCAKRAEISIKSGMASKQRSTIAKSPSPSKFPGASSGRRGSLNIPFNPSGHLNGRRIATSPSAVVIVGKSCEISPSGPSSHARNNENISCSPSIGSLSVRRNTERKVVGNICLLEIGAKKPLKPPAASLLPVPSVTRVTSLKPMRYRNSKASSPIMNLEKARKAVLCNEEIREKTLSVIQTKPDHKIIEPLEHDDTINQSSPSYLLLSSLPSCPSVSSNEDNSKESEAELPEGGNIVYKHDKTETNGAKDVKSRDSMRPRSSAMLHPESSVPEKLRFQRGKLVSLEPNGNGPRRLKFRPGRAVGDNQMSLYSESSSPRRLKFRQRRVMAAKPSSKVEIGTRSFRGDKDLGGDDANATIAETPTIVLRHQDMLGNKDEQGLFNHVIEETANKLVETKKSKVKALVGAFETVISLQGSKPATIV